MAEQRPENPRKGYALDDFIGLRPVEVHERLQSYDETEIRKLLVDMVIRWRGNTGKRVVCPGCRDGHKAQRPKFTDGRGRVWHTHCVGQALKELHPEVEIEMPVEDESDS